MDLIKDWFVRRFSDPQVLILTLLLIAGFAIVLFLGKILAPLFAAVVIAYLLEGLVQRLERFRLPRVLAVTIVVLGFFTLALFLTVGVVPVLTRQISQFVQQIPAYIEAAKALLLELPERYPNLLTEPQVNSMVGRLQSDLATWGQQVVTMTISSLTGVITFVVFLVLVPVLVFFLMKDKDAIMGWVTSYLPRERHLATRVWVEVDGQIGNYVRGKVVEIMIVGVVTYITFSLLSLQYAILLATLVGFSVLIPYIGALVVTLPVALVAFFQFGPTSAFVWVIIAYAIIQLIDGNALVPLLFSEVVDLHPIAIIVAVLLFGGLWGFWGVFFAIPLATLCNAVLRAIPALHPTGDAAARPSEAAEEASAAAEATTTS